MKPMIPRYLAKGSVTHNTRYG